MARARLQTSEFVADSSDPWLSPRRSNDRGRRQKLELASGKMLMKRCLSSKYVVHHPGAPLADKLSISGKSNRSRCFPGSSLSSAPGQLLVPTGWETEHLVYPSRVPLGTSALHTRPRPHSTSGTWAGPAAWGVSLPVLPSRADAGRSHAWPGLVSVHTCCFSVVLPTSSCPSPERETHTCSSLLSTHRDARRASTDTCLKPD